MPDPSDRVEAFVQLDLLVLRAHTEAAGDRIDYARHRETLSHSLAISEICEIRRGDALLAYAVLRPDTGDCWFVGAFNIHPNYRTPGIFAALARAVLEKLLQHSVRECRSNVYRTNLKSIELHRRLGFIPTKENAKGIEFRGDVAKLLEMPVCQWLRQSNAS